MAYADTFNGVQVVRSRAVIGPNAVLQTEAALEAAGGTSLVHRVFERAGLERLLEHRPEEMIEEQVPQALFAAMFDSMPRRDGIRIALDAGRRTGRYILENRIPMPVRWLLKLLPADLAAPLLLSAIERHAWTFAGSGECRVEVGPPARLHIANNPMRMPLCAWHTGVLEVLFKALVAERTQIVHTTTKPGARSVCTFTMTWGH